MRSKLSWFLTNIGGKIKPKATPSCNETKKYFKKVIELNGKLNVIQKYLFRLYIGLFSKIGTKPIQEISWPLNIIITRAKFLLWFESE